MVVDEQGNETTSTIQEFKTAIDEKAAKAAKAEEPPWKGLTDGDIFVVSKAKYVFSNLDVGCSYEIYNRSTQTFHAEIWRSGEKGYEIDIKPNGRIFGIMQGDELRVDPAPPKDGYKFALIKYKGN